MSRWRSNGTGISPQISTIHASSATQALARFTSCVLESGVELPFRSIKTNIGDSLNAVVHIERRPGCRFISEVVELHGYDPDTDLFNYSPVFQKKEGNAWARLSPEHRRP
jgi:pilus assembly protein CpaF